MRVTLGIVAVLLSGFVAHAQTEEPSTQPALIDAADTDALTQAMGKEVIIEGVVASAQWSRTGKVMNIEFVESQLIGAAFESNRARLDEAFGGDMAKTLSGARVRIKAKLREYGGYSEAYKGRPQIIINRPDQVTILEEATTQPAGSAGTDGQLLYAEVRGAD